MNFNPSKRVPAALFFLGGMLAGYLSYRLAGCTTGTCLITATPLSSMLYMGFVGWLLSGALSRGCCRVPACDRDSVPETSSRR